MQSAVTKRKKRRNGIKPTPVSFVNVKIRVVSLKIGGITDLRQKRNRMKTVNSETAFKKLKCANEG